MAAAVTLQKRWVRVLAVTSFPRSSRLRAGPPVVLRQEQSGDVWPAGSDIYPVVTRRQAASSRSTISRTDEFLGARLSMS
jgi:hypothetical protein